MHVLGVHLDVCIWGVPQMPPRIASRSTNGPSDETYVCLTDSGLVSRVVLTLTAVAAMPTTTEITVAAEA